MNPFDPSNSANQVFPMDNPFHGATFINVEYYFYKIYVFLVRISGGTPPDPNNYGEVNGASTTGVNFHFFTDLFSTLLYILLLFFVTVAAYVVVRMLEIRKKEHEHLHHEIHEYAHKHKEMEEKKAQKEAGGSGKPRNPRWETILTHLYSESSADWKLAIIDADEMLFGLMNDMGFKGESLGDKLKSADRDEFHSLSAAWEVHTVRNRIAHEGLSYELTQREAKRVIALYEQIFHEFGYV